MQTVYPMPPSLVHGQGSKPSSPDVQYRAFPISLCCLSKGQGSNEMQEQDSLQQVRGSQTLCSEPCKDSTSLQSYPPRGCITCASQCHSWLSTGKCHSCPTHAHPSGPGPCTFAGSSPSYSHSPSLSHSFPTCAMWV